MKLLAAICGLTAACIGESALGQACGDALGAAASVDSPVYVVAFRTQPAKVEVGRHFAVELIVCPKGAAAAAEAVRIDGFMPEHGHGMNYKAAVTPLGSGRYRAEGLLFHMPGRWELIFDVRAGGKTERLKHNITLQ